MTGRRTAHLVCLTTLLNEDWENAEKMLEYLNNKGRHKK